jgi:hypothetical protein
MSAEMFFIFLGIVSFGFLAFVCSAVGYIFMYNPYILIGCFLLFLIFRYFIRGANQRLHRG